ncbi:S1 family peptidase [Amycolatopsis nigrescens]|uniref:S1 family peptidase n=1 Tax=Amycolatopsis nigrescens TaxID=381445 RepID=UPI00036F5F22|nr:S1 family peptidase [Amycolatopsis nigrescens]
MKHKNLIRALAVAGVSMGSAVALSMSPATAAGPQLSQGVLTAMQRDLGMEPGQVLTRLATESAASRALPAAQSAAGAAFGGAWFDTAAGKLVVGLTDQSAADAVRATGAETVRVANTEAALDTAKAAIDRFAGQTAPKAVTGWYVDAKSNSVVVKVRDGAQDAEVGKFLDFAKSAGPVRVEQAKAAPRVLAGDVVGGDAYYIGGSARCSIGFSVNGGFVSAGHCGSQGDSVTGSDQSDMGSFAGSSFPGDDYSHVEVNSSWTPTPVVNGYDQGDVTVTGSSESAVGASICRSGSTTGWHCGTVQAKNQTVNYAEGTVTGLTQTDACAEPGDSGGSWVSGTEAQGVTSGGSGDCTSGGETFFQPVNEILSAYSLTLVTG